MGMTRNKIAAIFYFYTFVFNSLTTYSFFKFRKHWFNSDLTTMYEAELCWETFLEYGNERQKKHIQTKGRLTALGIYIVINYFSHGRCVNHSDNVISKQMLQIKLMCTFYEVALGCMPLWWHISIGSGNDSLPSGNKPLYDSMLTQICVVIWRH